ncbi:MAG: hypothetical protein JSS98_13905 [Bacteroidetes bacterium]|nr:hypothetical protein [Bacteroidota bacterium]
MSTSSHVSRRITAGLAILFLLPSLILFIIYSTIGLSATNISADDKIDRFTSHFPSWASFSGLQVFSIICCVIAISLAARSFKKHLLWVRVMMLMVVIVALFIILFNIYQMV